VAGVAEAEGARFRIEDSVEKGHEFSGGNVFAEEAIDFAADLGGALRVAGKGADGGLHIGHQERGGYAFTDHIGDADSQPAIAEAEHIVVVSADGAGGAPGSGDLETRNLGNLFGKQRALNVAGTLEFLLL
jgi:hypothetical protein